MKSAIRSALVLLTLGASACGGTSDDDGSGEKKVFEREQTPDSRFKPDDLESTIDDLVTKIEDSEGSSDGFAFGVVLKELGNFWRPVAVGANRALGELEVIGSVQGTTQEDLTVEESVTEQISFVEQQIDLGINGLAIAPHNEDLLPSMEIISESGAPIVTIDSDLPTSERDIYIGTDNEQAGVTGGETLLDFLDGKKGRVIVLGNTDPSWLAGFDRTNAAAQVLTDAGNTVEIVNSLWVPADEVEQISEVIADESGDEPLVGMIGVFANAYALADAAVEADLDKMPKIVAFDAEPDTLSYMEQGIISATHAQRQYYMGYMSVYLLYSINTIGLKETKSTLGDHLLHGFHLDTGLDVIRAKDLDEYNSFIDDLGI